MIPQPIAIFCVLLCLYLLVRDDLNPVIKERFGGKPTPRACDDEDYYNELAWRERQQRPEYN